MRDMGRDRSTLTLCFLLALMCLSDSWLHFTSKLPMMIGLDIVAGWTLLLAIGIRFRYRASLEGLLLPWLSISMLTLIWILVGLRH
jgi:hypothetical protein